MRNYADLKRLLREPLAARMMRLHRLARKGGRRDRGEGETVPVEPNRPSSLSGGAAAALEFDD